ncbi:unnamed protein product [Notodromas monacha]|uniref:SSD domain-containing protein n=1 Tax=Notodromas monacha TaxID=399045 RepID=A0A7R9GEM2_9CRUS|nr:unnamed protein product [Notodromas monacha]CAG0919765.1 unnamed protein product [Notodromas monacha]
MVVVTGIHSWFHHGLQNRLFSLALSISERPKTYTFVPILVTILLSLGCLFGRFDDDIQGLYTGTGTRVDLARVMFKQHFDKTQETFLPGRIVDLKAFARVLVMTKNGSDVLAEGPYGDVVKVEEFIRGLSVTLKDEEGEDGIRVVNKKWKYEDLCALNDGHCVKNPVIQLGKTLPAYRKNETEITFPVMIDDEDLSGSIFLPGSLAKPQLRRRDSSDNTEDLFDEQGIILSTPGVSLFYFLNTSSSQNLERAKRWEHNLMAKINDFSKSLNHVDVYYFTGSTFADESLRIGLKMIPIFGCATIVVFFYALFSGLMRDPIQSKPYFAFAGLTSASMAIISTLGITCTMAVPFTGLSMSGPLLLLGIGLDDTFVMLAAWRSSPKNLSADKRLAHAYSEAAVSLFITTMTDCICFIIGSLTPYPGINYFCLLSGIGVIVLLAYQLTFFGALMYFMGKKECENRDALTFAKVSAPKDGEKPTGWKFFRDYTLPAAQLEKAMESSAMAFFRDIWAPIILHPVSKTLTVLLMIGYLGISAYLASGLEVSFDRSYLADPDSDAVKFFTQEEEHFFDWPARPMIGVFGDVDYSDRVVQKDMALLLGAVENNHMFAGSLFSDFWLQDFLQFVKINDYYEPMDISNEQAFIDVLKTKYLTPDNVMSKDVVFNENGTKIVASRFIVQVADLSSFGELTDSMTFLWRLTDTYKDRYDIRVYHPSFRWAEQIADVMKYSLMTGTAAAVSVLGISLLLIPRKGVSVWIAGSILSVTLGVIGFMVAWGLSLNLISMIGLLLGTGFSVDFMAHIAYAFAVSPAATPDGKARDALYRLGVPILQGGCSTLLSTAFINLLDAYVFIALIRIVVLIMLFGMLHALLFFPVLQSLIAEVTEWCSGPRHTDEDLEKNDDIACKVPVIHMRCGHGHFSQALRTKAQENGCLCDTGDDSNKTKRSPIFYDPGLVDGVDKLIFYPAMIVLSRRESPELDAKFSCVARSALSTESSTLQAVSQFSLVSSSTSSVDASTSSSSDACRDVNDRDSPEVVVMV